MTDLERLDEALGDWAKKAPTEGGYSEEHASGVPCVRLAWIGDDGYAHEVDPLMLDAEGVAKLCVVIDAARAYRDLLANGERVEPDYEAAFRARWDEEIRFEMTQTEFEVEMESVRLVVDAAIGGRLLVDPPKEEGYRVDHPYEPKDRHGGLCCEFIKSVHPPKEEER